MYWWIIRLRSSVDGSVVDFEGPYKEQEDAERMADKKKGHTLIVPSMSADPAEAREEIEDSFKRLQNLNTGYGDLYRRLQEEE